MRASTLWRVAVGLLALHALGAIVAWSSLPDRVPIHFGFRGAADAWAPTSVVSWFGPLVISAALAWFIHAINCHAAPELWNIPEKQRFLQLPPEKQEPILDRLRAFVAATAICTVIVFSAIQLGIYLTARGVTSGLPWYVHLLMLGPIALVIVGSIRLSRAVRREVRRVSPS